MWNRTQVHTTLPVYEAIFLQVTTQKVK